MLTSHLVTGPFGADDTMGERKSYRFLGASVVVSAMLVLYCVIAALMLAEVFHG